MRGSSELNPPRVQLGNLAFMKAKLPKILLLLSGAISLAGCADYRSGKHWSLSDGSDWQQVSYVKWMSKTCSSPATISTQATSDGYAHSLFFIPLGFGGPAENPKTTSFFVTGEGLTDHCDNTTLEVSVNGRTRNDAQIAACTRTKDCCTVDVPVRRDTIETLQIAFTSANASCTYTPLKLNSRRHFCMRATRFGGSEDCGY